MSSAAKTTVETTGAYNVRHHRANTRGVSALMYASQQGKVDRVRKIIREQPLSLFERDRTGKTALHYCCTSDNICAAHAADILVMAAPDLVDGRDEDGFTPLHLAVIAGNMQLVTFLLANNADVGAVDNEKHTVVHWATVCGETAALRAVLAAGAPVSTPDVHGGYPLHYAAQMCGGPTNDRDSSLGMQVLQTLLSHSDIVVSVADGDKRQPLLWAASAGSAKAVLALIRAGAAVEAADKDGLTALHCAASRGHTDCLDTLLTLCGASPDVIDSNGCTALHYAVTLGHADATALLLAHGTDPNRQDRKGRSPAHCGCAKGQFETVKLIGSHGANLWLRNARGDLPLHEAAASGRRELVKWLLEMRPSQANARNNDGRCPLHMAALNDNADMCKILLDAGAQVNPILRTSKNVFMTPLDCALQRGFRSTAKYLQLHGGVPATRLSEQRIQPLSSALNLQIRDDVTFWGDTSSESERENGGTVKSSKRTNRKKLVHKHERKKASLSGSDTENGALPSSKVENKKVISERSSEKKTNDRLESSDSAAISSKRSGSRKLPTSRLDYANEIIINGKTEINIHQTREIIIDKAGNRIGETVVPIEAAVPQQMAERDRRPRSAKYSRAREKSAKSSAEKSVSAPSRDKITSPETAIQQERKEKELRKQQTLRDQSTNTSEETVIESKETKMAELEENETFLKEEDRGLSESKRLPDQQSLLSNTSEDIENYRNLIVEASVHAPPKSLQNEELEEQKLAENEIASLGKETEEPTAEQDQERLKSAIKEDKGNVEAKSVTNQSASQNDTTEQNQEKNAAPVEEKDTEQTVKSDDIEEKKPTVINENKEIREKGIKVEDAPEIVVSKEIEEVTENNKEKVEDAGNSNKETDTPPTIKDDSEIEPDNEAEKLKTTEDEDIEQSELKHTDEKLSEAPTVAEQEVKKEDTDPGAAKKTEQTAENNADLNRVDVTHVSDTTNLEVDKQSNIPAEAKEVSQTVNSDVTQKFAENSTEKSDDEEEDTIKEGGTLPETTLDQNENDITTLAKDNIKLDKKVTEKESKQDVETTKTTTESFVTEQKKVKVPKATGKTPIKPGEQQLKQEITADEKSKAKKTEETMKKKRVKEEKGIKMQKGKKEDHSEEESSSHSEGSSLSTPTKKTHKSFRILDEGETVELDNTKSKRSKTRRSARKGSRSRSTENKIDSKEKDKSKRSKIPTPLAKTTLSKSDRHLDRVHKPERKFQTTLDARVPSLPNIHQNKSGLKEPPRSESNMSAPLLTSLYSDIERDSLSEMEEGPTAVARSKKRVKKRSKAREARSAGSDYESSNLIDSGFEPSPRSTRIPKWKHMSERGVNMTSVTQSIQGNIRRYHLERKIFQHLLELKRLQIRAGQHNEAVLVKRAIDAYHQSCASTVGAGRYIPEDFTFKSFEQFLYESLRKLQKNDVDYMRGLPEAPTNPLLCTRSTNRCMHATHAYTGIPCAAYCKYEHECIKTIGGRDNYILVPKMDHHTIPKIGFNDVSCKPGTGFLPNINSKKAVTLELSHGTDKQVISLPTDRLDQNKRYYVTFTVKGSDRSPSNGEDGPNNPAAHRHSKSD